MKSCRSIAVGQTCPVRGDVDANIRQHVRLAQLAASERAQLILFPELSLTGYELELAGGLAFVEADQRLAPLMEVAAACTITVVTGAPVRIDGRLHIGALCIGPDRSTILYTKHRLGAFSDSASQDGAVPPAESTVFQPGTYNPLVRVNGNSVAIGICADVCDPAHPKHAVSRGATIYLASMFVIPSEFDAEAANLRTYAAEHSLLVAFANFGGSSGGLAAAGRSGIWSEQGEPLVQLPADGSGIGVVRDTADGWVANLSLLENLEAI
jgi:predicted amidohydrolase